MKINLFFALCIVLGLFLVSCSVEDGESGLQEEASTNSLDVLAGSPDNVHSHYNTTGDHERTDGPSTD